MTPLSEPRHLAQLQARLRNRAKALGREASVIDRLVANVVVGQLLPPGVLKGGTALMVRMGEVATRFSRDLDAARAVDLDIDDYLDQLDANLIAGWHGFTGTLRTARAATAPPSVPPDYVMKPFKVAVSYKGSAWVSVDLEIGRDEVGSTVAAERRIARSIVEIFASVGLPWPDPIPLMPVDHQMAQKIHACTYPRVAGGNDRAHDLVDLQLLVREEDPDLKTVGATARRLFAARRSQAWPPKIIVLPGWHTIYAEAAASLDVLPTAEAAADWLNEIIARM